MSTAVFYGNLASDPKYFKGKGTKRSRALLTVAVERPGEDNDEADFLDVTAFGYLADHAADSLEKGQRVLVYGRASTYTQEVEIDGKEVNITRTNFTAYDLGPSLIFGTTEFERGSFKKSKAKSKDEDEDDEEETKKSKSKGKGKGKGKSNVKSKGKGKSKPKEDEDEEDDDF